MRKIVLMTLIAVLVWLSACKENKEYKLVWQDEFDYVGLPDSSKWAYDQEGNPHGWGNNEAQFYTNSRRENAWVEDGKLHIIAVNEAYEGKEFTSARLMSKADWQHGRVEVRAKLPKGIGTWSAIWMMPGGWTFNDGNWPNIGEIDIMEHVGYDLGTIHASAHSKDYQWQAGTQQTATVKIPHVDSLFYTYALEWTADSLKAFVDDQQYFAYANEGLGEDKWPYEKPFYLLLNLAVGGAWGSVEGIDTLSFPQTMEVDYVRIYQK
ncbi:glycoside hydrolase family 16 protein [Carboxylicivirga mesophila]|uniref:Glycoside hydrolase family 16 protein n=1 Tax=Carboxylicivirga mesophila TaxID=1166478 RepID=A0ABS5K5S9_9BACT|nr:glycoside hydrolase family 16 protein [Carboxylicivirga mesophila]MBS2210311.1 glycoside hydrolase family 16 protein [Carboxylicivirga mesophila]